MISPTGKNLGEVCKPLQTWPWIFFLLWLKRWSKAAQQTLQQSISVKNTWLICNLYTWTSGTYLHLSERIHMSIFSVNAFYPDFIYRSAKTHRSISHYTGIITMRSDKEQRSDFTDMSWEAISLQKDREQNQIWSPENSSVSGIFCDLFC